jgi:hypothetical protein
MTYPISLVRFVTAAGLLGSTLPIPSCNRTDEREEGGRAPVRTEPGEGSPLGRAMALRMWKLTLALRLDQAAASRVFTVLQHFDVQMQRLDAEGRRLARELATETSALEPAETRLLSLVERIRSVRACRNSLEERRLSTLRDRLTLPQQATLILMLSGLGNGRGFR